MLRWLSKKHESVKMGKNAIVYPKNRVFDKVNTRTPKVKELNMWRPHTPIQKIYYHFVGILQISRKLRVEDFV